MIFIRSDPNGQANKYVFLIAWPLSTIKCSGNASVPLILSICDPDAALKAPEGTDCHNGISRQTMAVNDLRV